MARPTPCIGCGVQLGEDSELTLKYSDPFDCTTEGGLILKTDDTLQVVDGELGVVPSTYPTLFDEDAWGDYTEVHGSYIDTGTITASTTIRFGGGTLDKTISVTNTTDKTYLVVGSWQIIPFIATVGTTYNYSVFFDTSYDLNGSLGVVTSRYDGFVRGRLGDTIAESVLTSGSNAWTVAPGQYLNWGGSPAYRVDTTGNSSWPGGDNLGFHFARFRLVGTPLG